MNGMEIGEVNHFYNRISVAVLTLFDSIRVGDRIHIVGHTTDFQQQVTSLQIEHVAVDEAQPGYDVAMAVDHRVRQGDKVLRLGEAA